MKIIFWGSDPFALPTLEVLFQRHELLAVICQPDQPAGRRRQLTPPETKIWAQQKSIPVLQPAKLKKNEDLREALRQFNPDISVVISYGKIIPEDILHIPRYHSINVHGSLLPLLRGASPIESALWQGFLRTGLTVQEMAAEMDAGDILLTQEINIQDDWDAGRLREELSLMSSGLVQQTLEELAKDSITRTVQDPEAATFCGKIEKDDLWIDWTQSAQEIRNQIRALSPRWGARSLFQGRSVKIWQVEIAEQEETEVFNDNALGPGSIALLKKSKLVLVTGQGFLELVKLQPENKKAMSAGDFINGFRPQIGDTFQSQK